MTRRWSRAIFKSQPYRRGRSRAATLRAPTLSRWAGAVSLLIGLGVLLGWATGMEAVTAVVPGLQRMNPMTAVCLALCGLALMPPRTTRGGGARRLRQMLGGAVAMVATAKLLGAAAQTEPFIDHLLFPERTMTASPALMALNTAVALTMLGVALVLTTFPRRSSAQLAQVCAAGALVISTTGLIGYAFGAETLYTIGAATVMALPTAIALAALSLGVLALRPSVGIAGLVTNDTLGGRIVRRLLPLVTLIIVILGAGRVLLARLGLVDEITGIAVLTMSAMIALAVTVLLAGRELHQVSLKLAARERALITTADALERARDVAEASARVKSEFIANMSHEIRTPLTAVLGFADLLRRRQTQDETSAGYVERIAAAGNGLLALVNDVLDFSKLEAGKFEIRAQPTAVRPLLDETLCLFSLQAERKGLDLGLDFDSRLPEAALLDGDRLRQALINLLGNAVKFTDAGHVRLRAMTGPNQSIRIEVEDTGPGLDAGEAARLFQRFSQVDGAQGGEKGGTGLGLAISRGIVEAMGGQIGVRSRRGHGAIFYLTLPAPAAELPASIADEALEAAPLRGVRVLVVDDNPANRELASQALAAFEASVTLAADGVEALAHLGTERFDVVLLDLRMPGLSGHEVLVRLRAGGGPNQRAPVLAFTADGDVGGETDLSAFDGLLRKPFLAMDVAAAVDDCLPPAATARSERRRPAA